MQFALWLSAILDVFLVLVWFCVAEEGRDGVDDHDADALHELRRYRSGGRELVSTFPRRNIVHSKLIITRPDLRCLGWHSHASDRRSPVERTCLYCAHPVLSSAAAVVSGNTCKHSIVNVS